MRPSPPPIRTFDLLTLNVWGLPWPLSTQRRRRFGRIVQYFERQPPQIAGLQEVWRFRYRKLPLTGLRLPRGRRDTGLALAGSLAGRSNVHIEHFRHAAGIDRLVSKGLLVVETGPLTVAVTHLQAGLAYAGIRARQVAQVLEIVESIRGPLVLMGDFNFYDEHPTDTASDRTLAEAGLTDVARLWSRAEPTYISRNPFTRGVGAQRYDRIYLRDGGEYRLDPLQVQVPGRILSDHLPVRALVALRRAEGAGDTREPT